jgi:hypothetical protein
MFLAVRIEYAFDATIQRSHNPDARKHPVMVGNHSPAFRTGRARYRRRPAAPRA